MALATYRETAEELARDYPEQSHRDLDISVTTEAKRHMDFENPKGEGHYEWRFSGKVVVKGKMPNIVAFDLTSIASKSICCSWIHRIMVAASHEDRMKQAHERRKGGYADFYLERVELQKREREVNEFRDHYFDVRMELENSRKNGASEEEIAELTKKEGIAKEIYHKSEELLFSEISKHESMLEKVCPSLMRRNQK